MWTGRSAYRQHIEHISAELCDINTDITLAFKQCNSALSSAQTTIESLQGEIFVLKENNRKFFAESEWQRKDHDFLLDTFNWHSNRMVQLENRSINLIKGSVLAVKANQISSGIVNYEGQENPNSGSKYWPGKWAPLL